MVIMLTRQTRMMMSEVTTCSCQLSLLRQRRMERNLSLDWHHLSYTIFVGLLWFSSPRKVKSILFGGQSTIIMNLLLYSFQKYLVTNIYPVFFVKQRMPLYFFLSSSHQLLSWSDEEYKKDCSHLSTIIHRNQSIRSSLLGSVPSFPM